MHAKAISPNNYAQFAQSWRYKPGQYIAGASGCGPPALPYKGLDNGPSSSSSSTPFTLYYYRPPGAASGQPRPQDGSSIRTAEAHRPPVRHLSSADLLHRRPQRLAQRTKRAHALRQARSSCQLTGRRVRPGVTATTPLTLAAASHWLAGPSLGLRHRQGGCHYRARPRERQALIRECLGQC